MSAPVAGTPVAGTGNLTDLVFSSAPRRVVSLVPSVTGSLFDLQLGHCLAGVTDFCVYPPAGVAGLPKVGGTKNPDVARILALQPDLVIANQEENRREDVAALAAACDDALKPLMMLINWASM